MKLAPACSCVLHRLCAVQAVCCSVRPTEVKSAALTVTGLVVTAFMWWPQLPTFQVEYLLATVLCQQAATESKA